MKRIVYLTAVIGLLVSDVYAGTLVLKGASSPAAAAVPTLSEWGAIIMASLLVLFGMRMIKEDNLGTGIAAIGVGIIAIPMMF